MIVKVLCHECLEYFLIENPFTRDVVECPICGHKERVKTGIQSSGRFVYYIEPRGARDDKAP